MQGLLSLQQRNFILYSRSDCVDAKQILEQQVLYQRNRRELELNPVADSSLLQTTTTTTSNTALSEPVAMITFQCQHSQMELN